MKLSGLKKVLIFSFAFMMLISFVSTASATNGYFAHGYSIKNKALAGAGTALPLDSLAASTNPAGMALVGSRMDFGISFFNPNREYSTSCGISGCGGNVSPTAGTVESDTDWFIIPSFGYNRMMNENYSIGISIYGNGGMNTDYDTTTYQGGSTGTGVDLMQLFIVPTYARKLNEKHSIGVSPIVAYQAFEAKGLEGFETLSSSPSSLSSNGHDTSFGFGARIGYLGEIASGLFIGASYQTRIWMDEFDDYSGLFAEHGDFDIPSNWSVGLAYKATTDLTLALDVQQILYGEVDSIGNAFNPAFNTCRGAVMGGNPPASVPQCLGGDAGVGFGWEDMTIVKLGAQYQSSPEWTWRAGYSYGEQPIPSSEVLFNIIAPGVIEHHITAGFTRSIKDNQEIDFAVMYAVENDISGANPLAPTTQTITLQMNQWEFSAGYTYKF